MSSRKERANYHCFSCRKVAILVAADTKECPACGSTNGELIDNNRLREGIDSGVFYNIDPGTGKRLKKKK